MVKSKPIIFLLFGFRQEKATKKRAKYKKYKIKIKKIIIIIKTQTSKQTFGEIIEFRVYFSVS
jgi:hypothetical protein